MWRSRCCGHHTELVCCPDPGPVTVLTQNPLTKEVDRHPADAQCHGVTVLPPKDLRPRTRDSAEGTLQVKDDSIPNTNDTGARGARWSSAPGRGLALPGPRAAGTPAGHLSSPCPCDGQCHPEGGVTLTLCSWPVESAVTGGKAAWKLEISITGGPCWSYCLSGVPNPLSLSLSGGSLGPYQHVVATTHLAWSLNAKQELRVLPAPHVTHVLHGDCGRSFHIT